MRGKHEGQIKSEWPDHLLALTHPTQWSHQKTGPRSTTALNGGSKRMMEPRPWAARGISQVLLSCRHHMTGGYHRSHTDGAASLGRQRDLPGAAVLSAPDSGVRCPHRQWVGTRPAITLIYFSFLGWDEPNDADERDALRNMALKVDGNSCCYELGEGEHESQSCYQEDN